MDCGKTHLENMKLPQNNCTLNKHGLISDILARLKYDSDGSSKIREMIDFALQVTTYR